MTIDELIEAEDWVKSVRDWASDHIMSTDIMVAAKHIGLLTKRVRELEDERKVLLSRNRAAIRHLTGAKECKDGQE